MTPIIEARGLRKRFGDVDALDGLDVVAESGHVTAVLAPNGAGKTTFVNAVATLIEVDEGSLRVGGIDVVSAPADSIPAAELTSGTPSLISWATGPTWSSGDNSRMPRTRRSPEMRR